MGLTILTLWWNLSLMLHIFNATCGGFYLPFIHKILDRKSWIRLDLYLWDKTKTWLVHQPTPKNYTVLEGVTQFPSNQSIGLSANSTCNILRGMWPVLRTLASPPSLIGGNKINEFYLSDRVKCHVGLTFPTDRVLSHLLQIFFVERPECVLPHAQDFQHVLCPCMFRGKPVMVVGSHQYLWPWVSHQ